jgi:predicted DNA-binding transcriptional regulator AlpA
MSTITSHAGSEFVQAPLPELIDVKAVAKLLSCSSRSVLRLAASGAMPKPHKLGNLTRWSRREIIEWIAAGCPHVGENQKNVTPQRPDRYSATSATGGPEERV